VQTPFHPLLVPAAKIGHGVNVKLAQPRTGTSYTIGSIGNLAVDDREPRPVAVATQPRFESYVNGGIRHRCVHSFAHSNPPNWRNHLINDVNGWPTNLPHTAGADMITPSSTLTWPVNRLQLTQYLVKTVFSLEYVQFLLFDLEQ
jgi:hypothetical protein